EVSVLKPDVTGQAEARNVNQWVQLTALPRQGGGRLFTLPPGAKTRALLVSERAPRAGYASELQVRLFAPRLHNLTPGALAYGDREYRPPLTDYIPLPA